MNYKRIYAGLLNGIQKNFGIDAAKKFDTMLRFHRKLDLKNPKTLADKVSYIELHEQSPLASICTDKYAVREYITKKGYERLLVPFAGGPWTSVEEIDFDALPDSFVLKATHGCKMNYFVPNKSQIDIDACKSEMNRWLNTVYGTYSMEPHYTKIQPRIYAEAYLGEMSQLTDYKFHCLNGIPNFVMTMTDREADGDKAMRVTLDLFDMEWNPVNQVVGANHEKAGTGAVPKPKCFDEMVQIATDLSRDFKFVRVDLYELNGQVLLGELTFSPACCVFPYLSEEFLKEMGNKLLI